MASVFLAQISPVAASPHGWALVLTSVLSGAAIAAFTNTLYAYLKDLRTLRQQRLEEIHRAVFTLTWGIQPSLLALLTELNYRKWQMDYKRGYAEVKYRADDPLSMKMPVDANEFSQDKLDKCNERIRQIRKDFPRDKIISELEVFVRLTSVYFEEIRDERYIVADYAMDAVRIHAGAPEHMTIGHNSADEATQAQILIAKGDKIRGRLLKRIWELPQPSLIPKSRFRGSKLAEVAQPVQPLPTPAKVSAPQANE